MNRLALAGWGLLGLGLLLGCSTEIRRAVLERKWREVEGLSHQAQALFLSMEQAGRKALEDPGTTAEAGSDLGLVMEEWTRAWSTLVGSLAEEVTLKEPLQRAAALGAEWYAALVRLRETHPVHGGEALQRYREFHATAVERAHEWRWAWSGLWRVTRDDWEQELVQLRMASWSSLGLCLIGGAVLWRAGRKRGDDWGEAVGSRLHALEKGDWTSPWPVDHSSAWGIASLALGRWTSRVKASLEEVGRAGVALLDLHGEWTGWLRRMEAREEIHRQASAECKVALETLGDRARYAHPRDRSADQAGAGNGRSGTGADWSGEASGPSWSRTLASAKAQLAGVPDVLESIQRALGNILKAADHSHLLSVNAAIEAEKAGEYGLGFAVVAGEVRRLADQTAVAAGEVEDALDQLRSQVGALLHGLESLERDLHGATNSGTVEPPGGFELHQGIERCRQLMDRWSASGAEAALRFEEAARFIERLERLGEQLVACANAYGLAPSWSGGRAGVVPERETSAKPGHPAGEAAAEGTHATA